MVKKSLASRKKNAYGYPKHTFLSFLVCFNESCVHRAQTTAYRKKHRFKGYKRNGPAPQQQQTIPEKEHPPVLVQKSSKEENTEEVRINKVYTLKNVVFETGKAQLNADSEKELDQLVEILNHNSNLIILLSGHTDNAGEEKANLALSQRRAQAVADYLTEKGIAASRVEAKGYGSSKPITSNHTKQERGSNRRVEFLIQAGK